MMDVCRMSRGGYNERMNPARTGLDVNRPESLSSNILQAESNVPWTLRGRTEPSMSSRKTAQQLPVLDK